MTNWYQKPLLASYLIMYQLLSSRNELEKMDWNWEFKGEASFQTPEVTGIYEGWKEWPADLAFSDSKKPSEIFTRELTQNFMDAARLMEPLRSGRPKLVFRFIKLKGQRLNHFRNYLELEDLSEKYKQISTEQRRSIKLPDSRFLEDPTAELNILVVTESGTCGMLGRWKKDNKYRDSDGKIILRRMRDALLDSAGSNAAGSLGSYGEGKRAIIASSNCRTILTYTAFDVASTDDGASRRLLGSTYWRPFHINEHSFSGLALLGEPEAGEARPLPFVNEAADQIVRDLGIEGFDVRDGANKEHWGTSQIFVEPIVDPFAIAEALERNWWPVITDGKAEFEVIDFDGNPVAVEPRTKETLKPFLRAWDVASGHSTASEDFETTGAVASGTRGIGRYGFAVDVSENGWSLKDPETNRSIVALVRDGMIISYQKLPRGKNLPQPFVRGVFEVNRDRDPESAELLRQVEPPLHNFWHIQHDAMDKNGMGLARTIYESLTRLLVEFREKFVEELVKQAVDLELFDELISVDGSTSTVKPPPPPPPPPSDWEILSDGGSIEQFDDLQRWAKASRVVKLKPDRLEQTVQIEVGWRVEGDNGKFEKETRLFRALTTKPPSFEEIRPGLIEGVLSPGQEIRMSWTSNPYQELWTLQPFVQVIKKDSDATELVIKEDASKNVD